MSCTTSGRLSDEDSRPPISDERASRVRIDAGTFFVFWVLPNGDGGKLEGAPVTSQQRSAPLKLPMLLGLDPVGAIQTQEKPQ